VKYTEIKIAMKISIRVPEDTYLF